MGARSLSTWGYWIQARAVRERRGRRVRGEERTFCPRALSRGWLCLPFKMESLLAGFSHTIVCHVVRTSVFVSKMTFTVGKSSKAEDGLAIPLVAQIKSSSFVSRYCKPLYWIITTFSVSNDDESTRQIQNKIDLREVLWARETEHPPQNLIFTKTAGHKTPTATAVLKS